MVKRVLAFRRRLEQKTMEPTMPRVDFPSGFAGLKKILSEKLVTHEYFVFASFPDIRCGRLSLA